MDALWHDFRYALRTIRRSPLVAALVVGSLTLAIAGNVTVFSLINSMLFRPLPYESPERLILVGEYQQAALAGSPTPTSPANFVDLRDRLTSFSGFAAFSSGQSNLGTGERAEPINVGAVTPNFFALLGSKPQLGRLFTDDEGTAGRDRVALLAHGFWQGRFGADPDIAGTTVTIDGQQLTVVGVLPEKFEYFADPAVKVWRPLVLDPAELPRQQRYLLAVGRLGDGVTTAEAQAETAALGQQLAEEYPDANRGYKWQAINVRTEIPDSRNRVLFGLLQGALLFVLLIACANSTNLLLARAQGRLVEIAVRSSLGAGRGRIVRQLITESLLMALLAGGLGLALGAVGTEIVGNAMAGLIPSFWLPVVDLRVVLFTIGLTLAGGLFFGLLPAIQTARLNIQTTLKAGGRGVVLGGRRRLLSRGLVVAEITLALVLLGGAGVLIQSFIALQDTDPGFETAELLTASITLPEESYPSPEERVVAMEGMLQRIAAVPGVEAVTASGLQPQFPALPTQSFTVEGSPPADGQAPPSASQLSVGPDFFATLGVTVEEGRAFDGTDRPDSAPVVLVNRALAERMWPGGEALGQRLIVQGTARRVVGVVEDVQHGIFFNEPGQMTIYTPLYQQPPVGVVVTARTDGDPSALATPLREATGRGEAGVVVGTIQTLEQFVGLFYIGMNVFTAILGGFGMLALLLAALGTYGVLAFAVAQRNHEIGVRMAIGAQRGQVMRMVTLQGLTLAGIGIALGIPGVLLVSRAIAAALSDFVAVQTGPVAAVAALLAVVTLVASWLPARRAARVDPAVALRMD